MSGAARGLAAARAVTASVVVAAGVAPAAHAEPRVVELVLRDGQLPAGVAASFVVGVAACGRTSEPPRVDLLRWRLGRAVVGPPVRRAVDGVVVALLALVLAAGIAGDQRATSGSSARALRGIPPSSPSSSATSSPSGWPTVWRSASTPTGGRRSGARSRCWSSWSAARC